MQSEADDSASRVYLLAPFQTGSDTRIELRLQTTRPNHVSGRVVVYMGNHIESKSKAGM
jgi:hypothetical protein